MPRRKVPQKAYDPGNKKGSSPRDYNPWLDGQETITCTKCGLTKQEWQFRVTAGTRQRRCKDCQREYLQEHRKKKKAEIKRKKRERNTQQA